MQDGVLRRKVTTALAFALACVLHPATAHAQKAVDVHVGMWAVDDADDATLYSVALWRNAWGPFGYSLRGLGLVDRGPEENSLYAFQPELTLLRGQRERAGLSAYAAGGVGLAYQTSASDVAALWSAGLGLEFRAASLFGATLEVRRTAEDTGFNGFWKLAEGDRRGWMISLGVSLRFGGGASGAHTPSNPASFPTAVGGGASASVGPLELAVDGDDVRGNIVRTALAAMGEPYKWGGTSTDEGFDCSGLVWYAYTSHGVTVPRVSRDQALAGRAVPRRIEALQAGDILTFSNRPGVVTHVGLYIGDARFIHATTSGGVRIGSLAAPTDGTDRWYLSRWVGARRVME